MKQLFQAIFILFISISAHSQIEEKPFVFISCADFDDPSECNNKLVSNFIEEELVSNSFYDLDISKLETIRIDFRMFFNKDGKFIPEYSLIYNERQDFLFEEMLLNFNSPIQTLGGVEERTIYTRSITYKISQSDTTEFDLEELKFEKNEYFIIDKVPVFGKCKSKWKNAKIIKCNSAEIGKYVSANFKVPSDLNDGIYRIKLSFKVDTLGNINSINAESDHSELNIEAVRVLKTIKKFKEPGYIGPKAVSVPFYIPIAIQK